MKRVLAVMLVCAAAGCGSEFNLPFSNANPTLPSNINIGSSERSGTSADKGEKVSGAGPRNIGTEVWLIPVPAGDLMKLAQRPELWPKAQKRVDVVSLYFLHAYHHEGFECGTPCGPNTYLNLMQAVPGGMYKWLSDRFALAMEAGSVKSHACTAEQIENVAFHTVIAVGNIKKSGGRLSYISLDEPFASGVGTEERGPFGPGYVGCGLTPAQVAHLQFAFNRRVHADHPEVQIGFIEPYPHFSADEIMSFMLELEHAGVPIPYFHLDFDQPRAVREKKDWKSDIIRMREFFRAKGIPFGTILVGWDGRTNEQYAAGYTAVVRTSMQAVGVTEHTVLQSWAEDPPGELNSLKHIPDTVPEANSVSHTGLLLWTLEFLGVRPSP